MKTHSIDNEIVVDRSNASVTLELFIGKESDFFDGHFPQFKLIPAVGQFELVSQKNILVSAEACLPSKE